jgi:hypothetical protein
LFSVTYSKQKFPNFPKLPKFLKCGGLVADDLSLKVANRLLVYLDEKQQLDEVNPAFS